MWAPSGPSVDGAGNIYAATGNGSSTTITSYDYGDSVLKFNSALALQSFFAPGSPDTWASQNANDADLGSIDPVLLSNGTLFELGKGGRGYLLNQSALPDNSNPGGGENFSAQVCNATNSAAFGGMAVDGNLVFVPCADGVAALSIDSASGLVHRVWYQTSNGGASPIVAGGLVWSGKTFGGSSLVGLQPTTGAIAVTLSLPGSTQHFVTPSAGDGHLYIASGNRLSAFAPKRAPGTVAPPAAAADLGQPGGGVARHRRRPLGGALRLGRVDRPHRPRHAPAGARRRRSPSAPVARWTWSGRAPRAASGGGGGHLRSWSGPFNRGMGPLGLTPTVTSWGTEVDVFWEGTDGQLGRAGRPAPAGTARSGWGWGPLGSAPTVAAHSGGEQDVFWKGTDQQLWEAYWTGSGWIGPQRIGKGPLNSGPSAGGPASGTQDVLWLGTDNSIWMTSYSTGSAWTGPTNVGMGPLGSQPAVAAWGTEVDAFWQGTNRNLWEAYRPNGGAWTGPQDVGRPLGLTLGLLRVGLGRLGILGGGELAWPVQERLRVVTASPGGPPGHGHDPVQAG